MLVGSTGSAYGDSKYAVVQLVEALHCKLEGCRYDPDGVIGFFIELILVAALGVDLAFNRNEYQEYLLGGEGCHCVCLTILPLSCADGLENLRVSTSWSPKGLSRPVQG
jgi:hypothetical protein